MTYTAKEIEELRDIAAELADGIAKHMGEDLMTIQNYERQQLIYKKLLLAEKILQSYIMAGLKPSDFTKPS